MCYIDRKETAPMTTTTIRLPEELKTRVGRLATAGGTTAHGFILEAVQQHVEAAEARAAFLREGARRLAKMERTGAAVPWQEARHYLLERAAGKQPRRPPPRAEAAAVPTAAKRRQA
jgi:predicted transcriptional regulator